MKTNSDELTPQQIAADQGLLVELHNLNAAGTKPGLSGRRILAGIGLLFLGICSYVVTSAMPQPYALLMWTLPSGVSPQAYRLPLETYMASEQECEEARAALGSKFRSECIPASGSRRGGSPMFGRR